MALLVTHYLIRFRLLIFNKNLQKDFKYIRKQSAQLPSKTRYIAHQFAYYLQDNNYLKIFKNYPEPRWNIPLPVSPSHHFQFVARASIGNSSHVSDGGNQ